MSTHPHSAERPSGCAKSMLAYGVPFSLRVELDRSRVERARGVRLLAATWHVLESIAALEKGTL